MLGDSDHYVPILKSKSAELNALKDLSPIEKGRVTPLIEVLPDTIPDEAKLKAFAKKLASAFGSKDPVFIDLSKIDAKKIALKQFESAGLKLIPVVSHTDKPAYHKLVGSFERACLRLDVNFLFGDQSASEVKVLIESLNKKPTNIDLIIDFGTIEPNSAPRNAQAARLSLGRLPFLNELRGIFVSATSFPSDLSGIRRDTILRIPREDWHMFLQLRSLSQSPSIGFSDYAIQNPEVANIDPRIISISSQLRITEKNDWLWIKGRSTKTASYEYIRKVCQAAIDNSDPPIDANLSAGDKFILQCASGATGTGNATTWRQAGFSRHFAVVLSQLE